jgi:PAS domain S-box-containing protein
MSEDLSNTERLVRENEELRRTQRDLSAALARHEALLAALPDIVMEVDANRVYVWANQPGIAFFGSDVVGKEAAFYFEGAQDTYDRVRPLFQGDEETFYVESWQRRRDGEKRLLAWWCRALKDDAGSVIGALSTGRDVTEERSTAVEIFEAEQRFRSFFDNAPIGKSMTGPDGKLLRVNAALCGMLGYSADELQSMTFVPITHPDDVADSVENLRALFAGERDTWTTDKRYIAKDGRLVWAHVTTSLQRGSDGKPLYLLTHILDITERKQAEHDIEASETRYRRLFEAARDGILILDADTGMIVDVNPFLMELTGYSHEDFLGRLLWEIGAFKDIAASKASFAELQAEKYVRYDDLPLRARDGRKIDVEFVSNVYRVDNQRVIQCNIRDISERKRANREMESLSRFPSENPAPVLRLAPDGTLLYANAAAGPLLQYWGVEPGQCVPTEMLAPVAEAAASGKRLEREIHCSGRIYVLRICPVQTAGYVNVYGNDVTERRQAEDLFRQSEARFRILFEKAADSVLILEVTAEAVPVIRDANSAACRAFGYERDDLIGQPVSVIDGSPEAAKAVGERRRDIISGVATTFEVEHRCKDGTIKQFECSATEIQIGSKAFAISIERDITERKRAEEALRRAQAQLRAILDATPFPVALVDIEDDAIEFWSRSALTLFGHTAPTASAWYRLAYPDPVYRQAVIDRWKPALQQVRLSGQAVNTGEYRVTCRDGSVRICELYAALVAERLVVTFNDVTDRKRAEEERKKLQEQLLASQKMEAVGGLAGGIAHDFNNLLSVILSYGSFALEDVREGDPLRDDLLEINSAADRAARLTAQLLAFGRKQVLRPEPLDLNRVASEMDNMLRRIIGEDIELTQVAGPNLGVALADPSQIEQVIMNLVVNARDAMPEGGRLTIETSNVDLDEGYAAEHVDVKPGPYVMLAATDTGCGMDEQTRARIFEPFFTTKGPKKGTGLGLSTVYGIVRQSGGNITVYSEPGQGTTFKIYLPREHGAVAVTSGHPLSTAPAVGTETILVVEDEPALGTVVKRILGAAGYTVLVAQDGGEALLISEGHDGEIHLVLTDVIMPQMSGKAFVDRLVKVRPEIKVLYMSGYTDDAIVHHGVLDAGTQFIAKPFNAADLARKVREVLDEPATNGGAAGGGGAERR